jgi:hypothetical protein
MKNSFHARLTKLESSSPRSSAEFSVKECVDIVDPVIQRLARSGNQAERVAAKELMAAYANEAATLDDLSKTALQLLDVEITKKLSTVTCHSSA